MTIIDVLKEKLIGSKILIYRYDTDGFGSNYYCEKLFSHGSAIKYIGEFEGKILSLDEKKGKDSFLIMEVNINNNNHMVEIYSLDNYFKLI